MITKFKYDVYKTGSHEYHHYKWHGGRIEFAIGDIVSIEKLALCPLAVALHALGKNNIELLEAYLKQAKLELREQLLALLSDTWKWRETGDIAEIEPKFFGVECDMPTFIRQLKSRRSLPVETIQKAIEYFTRFGGEVYRDQDR